MRGDPIAELAALTERLEAMGLRRDESGWYDGSGVHVVGLNPDGTWWTRAVDSTPGNAVPDVAYASEHDAALVWLMEETIRYHDPTLARAIGAPRYGALERLTALPGGAEAIASLMASTRQQTWRAPDPARQAAAAIKRERKAKRRLEVTRG